MAPSIVNCKASPPAKSRQSKEIPVDDDKKHSKQCKNKFCARCSYFDHGSDLQKLTPLLRVPEMYSNVPIEKTHLAKLSWLSSRIVDGTWGHVETITQTSKPNTCQVLGLTRFDRSWVHCVLRCEADGHLCFIFLERKRICKLPEKGKAPETS